MAKKMMCPMQMGSMMMCPMQMGNMMMGQMNIGDTHVDEDEKDEQYFMGMYPESCTRIMPYIIEVLDNAEQKDDKIYEDYPDRDMVRALTDSAYKSMVAGMPDMADDEGGERQFGPPIFARDLAGALLINELLRRRRRRRYFGYDGYDGYYGPGYYGAGYYDYY